MTAAQLRDGIRELDGDDGDAIIAVGTKLAMARLAGCAERWMACPVLAIDTAIYWHALRESGITDRGSGFGPLLLRYRFIRSDGFKVRDAASARNVITCPIHAAIHARPGDAAAAVPAP